MGFSESHIKNAAKSELRRLARTSFSGESFTSHEIDAIASAIAAAIKVYDEQQQKDKEI